MTIIVIILALLCIYKAEIADNGKLFPDYISKEKTIAVEGVFVLLVFIRHFFGYSFPTGEYDEFAKAFDNSLSQMIVTMFLFYSGYGVMESINRKGDIYTKALPGKIIKLLFHFDIAILLFLIVNACFGKVYSIKHILLSMVCWESVGNSNWYVLIILSLYTISWISFSLFRRNNLLAISFVTGLTVFFVLLIRIVKMEYWYNTILCYPLGMWYSLLRNSIRNSKTHKKEDGEKKTVIFYLLILLCAIVGYSLFYPHRFDNMWTYYIWACIFVFLVVLITMKIRLDNPFLQLLGKHVFSIYILQRIPMIILQRSGYFIEHPYLTFIISLIATIVLAYIFDYGMQQLDRIWNKKTEKSKTGFDVKKEEKQPAFNSKIKTISVVALLGIVVMTVFIFPMICSSDRTVVVSALGEKNESSLLSDVFLKKIKLNNQTVTIPTPSSGNWVWYKDHYSWLDNSEERIGESETQAITMNLSFQNKTQLVFSGNRWKGKLFVKSDDWETVADTYVDDDGWKDVVVTLPEPTFAQIVKYSILPGACFIIFMLVGGLLASVFSCNLKNKL